MRFIYKIVGVTRVPHASGRAIIAGGATIALFAVAAKLFSLLREVALANRYGTGVEIDAFNLAFTIVNFLPTIITSIISSSLVPALIKNSMNKHKEKLFLRELNALSIGISLILMFLVFATASLSSTIMTGSPASIVGEMTYKMTIQMAPVAGISLLAGYLAVRLQAQRRYLYTIAEGLPPLGVAIAVILPFRWHGGSILSAGLVFGAMLQLIFLFRLMRYGGGRFEGVSFRFTSHQWAHVGRAIGALALGAGVMWVTTPLEQAYAARLGAGAVASLSYANRLIGLGTGLSIIIVARALLPTFSKAIADGDMADSRRQAWRWSWVCAAIGVTLIILVWPLIESTVEILFKRGAFNGNDANTVAALIKIGIMQIPFFFPGIVIVQWLAANGQYRSIAISSIAAAITKIVIMELFYIYYGTFALIISTVIMYVVSYLILVFFLRKS